MDWTDIDARQDRASRRSEELFCVVAALIIAVGIGLGMPLAWVIDRALHPADYGMGEALVIEGEGV